MKTFLAQFRDIAISGFFALFPMYVLFIVITKAWTSLASVGTKMAGMFGLKSILGVGRYHRVLRASGDCHLDRGRITCAFYLYEEFEPSVRERVVTISSRL